MIVGIRELKAHLSDYVHRAQAGEVVVITDRGRPVAELRRTGTDPDDLPQALLRGLAEGWVTPPRSPGGLGLAEPWARLPAGLTTEQILTDDREEDR